MVKEKLDCDCVVNDDTRKLKIAFWGDPETHQKGFVELHNELMEAVQKLSNTAAMHHRTLYGDLETKEKGIVVTVQDFYEKIIGLKVTWKIVGGAAIVLSIIATVISIILGALKLFGNGK